MENRIAQILNLKSDRFTFQGRNFEYHKHTDTLYTRWADASRSVAGGGNSFEQGLAQLLSWKFKGGLKKSEWSGIITAAKAEIENQ
jgi:hypothetical protein